MRQGEAAVDLRFARIFGSEKIVEFFFRLDRAASLRRVRTVDAARDGV